MAREKSQSGCVSGCLKFCVIGFVLVVLGVIFLRDPNSSTTSPDRQTSSSLPAAAPTVQEYDIVKSYQLRSGPGKEHDRKINQKASDKLGEIHYLSIDTSTTVQILQSQGDWVEIQVTQPDFLRDSHRGWVPKDAIKDGQSTNKRDGWIRYTCRVYPLPDKSSKPIGYLSPPSSVGVADDGSNWLRLLHGPVKHETTDEFVDIKFDPGLYIEKSKFTTELPAKWEQ